MESPADDDAHAVDDAEAADDLEGLARAALHGLERRGATLAVAESLTGGLLGATLTAVPGASVAFLGGITAYANAAKASLLGVPADLLERAGAVSPDVAVAMAAGARDRFGATYGVALTGVAGPDEQDGRPPGTVHVAGVGPAGSEEVALALAGDRSSVRRQAVEQALRLVRRMVEDDR
jgi:PncC family amidohydrolase